jgi:hypothetical protein
MKSRALRAVLIIVAGSLLLTVLWIWLALKWSFSEEGERVAATQIHAVLVLRRDEVL